jgi:hypothetical protein
MKKKLLSLFILFLIGNSSICYSQFSSNVLERGKNYIYYLSNSESDSLNVLNNSVENEILKQRLIEYTNNYGGLTIPNLIIDYSSLENKRDSLYSLINSKGLSLRVVIRTSEIIGSKYVAGFFYSCYTPPNILLHTKYFIDLSCLMCAPSVNDMNETNYLYDKFKIGYSYFFTFADSEGCEIEYLKFNIIL